MKTAMEKKLARALRALVNYTGGSDTPASHPCARAYATLAEYDASPKHEKRAPAVRSGSSFLVTWTIDSDKATPEDAARAAWESMRAPDSIANVFDVLATDGTVTRVDVGTLIEEDESDADEGPGMWGEGYDSEQHAYLDFARNHPEAEARFSALYPGRAFEEAAELDSLDPPDSWVFFHEWGEQKKAEGIPRKGGR